MKWKVVCHSYKQRWNTTVQSWSADDLCLKAVQWSADDLCLKAVQWSADDPVSYTHLTLPTIYSV